MKLPDACYIEDYCNFIRLMHQLQQEILRDFQTQSIFKDVQTFKKYRLHDLYIKLRCANFLILLKEKLTNIGPVQFLNNYADIRNVYKKRGIYLNQNIFRSVGQAAAFLYKKDGKNNDIYEIVVQGNQYRHGINSYQLADFKKEKIESQNKLWEAFDQRQAEKEFLSLSGVWDGEVVLPQTIRNNNKSSTKKCAAFCGYNHDYIYKYKDITSIAVDELLNMMANDIKKYYTTVVF